MALTKKWEKMWVDVFGNTHNETTKKMKKIASKIKKPCKD
jgi:hypothetical protein